MPLIILEGPRNTGKTHLFDKIEHNKFKFDFTGVYGGLKLNATSDSTHSLGLGKEIMLHQLFQNGIIGKNLVVDRGILTNQVWGVYQGRVSYDQIYQEINYMISAGLFYDVHIVLIGSRVASQSRKNKDHWDHLENENERNKEMEIFKNVSEYMRTWGVRIYNFENMFDSESEERFKQLIDNICAEY